MTAHFHGQFQQEVDSTTAGQQASECSAASIDLRHLIEAYELAAEASTDLVFVLDHAAEFAYVNPRTQGVLGYLGAEILGKPIRQVAVTELPLQEDVTTAAHGNEPLRIELRRKSGTTVWIELTLSLIVSGQETLGWLGVGRDISRQRRAEQRLLRANRELAAVRVVVNDATQAIDLQATLDTALERVLELLDVEVGAIFLISPRANRLEVVAQRGVSRGAIVYLWGPGLKPGEGVAGRVVESGEPLVLENLAPRPQTGSREEPVRVVACVPLRTDGAIVGAVGVGRRTESVFSADEVRMLANIGSTVGVVIENARLRAEIAARARRLESIYLSGRAIAEAPTLGAVFGTAVRMGAQMTRSSAVIAFMLDGDGEILRPVAAQGLSQKRWRAARVPISEPTLGIPLSDGRPVLCNRAVVGESNTDNITNRERTVFPPVAVELIPEARAVAAVPLQVKTRTIGALLAIDRTRGAYDHRDMEMLSCLSGQVSAAAEHKRLHDALAAQAERASALNEITKAVVASLDVEQVLKTLAVQVRRLIGYERLTIGLADTESRVLDVFVLKSGEKNKPGKGTRIKAADAVLGWVVANGRPVIRQNLEGENRYPWDGILAAAGLRSDVTVPLIARGRPIGALSLAADRVGCFRECDLELLQNIADKVSIAIDNATLHQQTMSALRELTALRELVESFSADLELDSLLSKIIVSAVDLVRADSGEIALMDESDQVTRLRALHNLPSKMLGKEITAGDGPLGQALITERPVLVQLYADEETQSSPDKDLLSHLAVPIHWQNKLIGTFGVGSRDRSRRFEPRDIEVLQLLAKHAAIAIENARLYQQSRHLAVTEERNRLARDIHDTLAQSLTGIVLQVETVAALLPAHPEEARQELREAGTLARRSLEEARQSVWDLRPTPLQSMTLDQAIEREMQALARQANLGTLFTVRGEVQPLQADVATALFRIAQEALSNIRKHSGARSVHGILKFDESHVTLTFEDDGIGISSTRRTSPSSGFGLTSMRERARLLGGELRLDSTPGRGTRLVATIPYQPPSMQLPRSSYVLDTEQEREGTIKVLVADDHPIARHGIRRILESCGDISVVGEASDGVEAVALCNELRPDVVLMDLQMPHMNGVQAIERLRTEIPDIKVLIISTYARDEFLFEGIKAGARGYLLKDVPSEELVQAVRAVSRGESLLQGVVAGKLLDRLGQMARGEASTDLTEREAEVLRLLASGARNKEIARNLFIAEKTVKFHVANIFRKLNVNSRTEAMAIAFERGLIER